MVIPDDATVVTRLKQGLRVWIAERRLRGKISELSEQDLDRALHELGLTRRELFTVSKRDPDHRNQMAKLLEHFGGNLERTLPRYWRALKDAERICTCCRNVKRCRVWLACCLDLQGCEWPDEAIRARSLARLKGFVLAREE